jgi:hypothetical protein
MNTAASFSSAWVFFYSVLIKKIYLWHFTGMAYTQIEIFFLPHNNVLLLIN